MPGHDTGSRMSSLLNVPNDLDTFLPWLKHRTEEAWSNFQTRTLDEFRARRGAGHSWRTGTKWRRGLEEQEIDAIERRWKIRFPADYRRFLTILNAPDRGMYSVGWRGEPPYDLREIKDQPSFFDWQRDELALTYALKRPLEGILFDVEKSSVWLESWGERPQGAEIRETVSRLVAAASRLVPLYGHRYLLGDPIEVGNPVLSVWQTDIITYGSNLREYLLLELWDLLKLNHEDVKIHCTESITRNNIAEIPFWGELIHGDH